MFKKLIARRNHKGGLKPLKLDTRDFHLGIFGIASWKPAAPEVDIKTLSVKNQAHNNCTFMSGTVQKELDEGVVLSARFATIKGIELGLVSGDGLSDLRTVQMVKSKFGICEEKMLPDDNSMSWLSYINPQFVTPEMMTNAATHKSQSFWAVTTCDQLGDLLDKGRTVTIGLDWRDAFNMRSGFSIPWILNFLISFVVGGHAVLVRGYKQNYVGVPLVFKVQNSYSSAYGDDGCFYIKPSDLQPYLNKYGAYTELDIPLDIGKFLMSYSNRVVKADESPNVYKIEGGKKRLFPDMPTLWSHGYAAVNINVVDFATLKGVPDGAPMSFTDGPNIAPVKGFAQVIANKNEDEKNAIFAQFKNYFADLFK